MIEQIYLQPPLRAVPIGLYPTMGSLQEVIDLAESRVPVQEKNTVIGLLKIYHNTLLQEIHLGH